MHVEERALLSRVCRKRLPFECRSGDRVLGRLGVKVSVQNLADLCEHRERATTIVLHSLIADWWLCTFAMVSSLIWAICAIFAQISTLEDLYNLDMCLAFQTTHAKIKIFLFFFKRKLYGKSFCLRFFSPFKNKKTNMNRCDQSSISEYYCFFFSIYN